mgnify:CR=1 FL=1
MGSSNSKKLEYKYPDVQECVDWHYAKMKCSNYNICDGKIIFKYYDIPILEIPELGIYDYLYEFKQHMKSNIIYDLSYQSSYVLKNKIELKFYCYPYNEVGFSGYGFKLEIMKLEGEYIILINNNPIDRHYKYCVKTDPIFI